MTPSVIVTDSGFQADDFVEKFQPLAADAPLGGALDIASSDDVLRLQGKLSGVHMIRIDFPSYADGRGFTLARRLRTMGYTGRLRAKGHVLADQYAMARRSGFDEVEISGDLAARQTEAQWLARAKWQLHDYRARLAG